MKKYVLSHPWLLSFSALSGGVLQGMMVLSTLLVASIVDAMIIGDRSRFFSYIGVAVTISVACWLLTAISTRMFFAYCAKSKRALESDFFDSILKMKISDFNQENSAKYISVLNNDISKIGQNYFQSVAQFSKDFLSVIFAVVAMAVISPINALIAVVTAFLPLVAPILYSSRLAKTQMKVSGRNIAYNQKVKDYLTGFEVIKTFGIENKIRPRFFGVATRLMQASYKAGAAVGDVGAITVFVVVAVMFVNYFVAGYFVFTGSMTVGGVVAIVSLSATILQPMTLVSNHISNIKSTKEISKRVLDMMEQKDTATRDAKIDALEGDIEFKDVSFSYDKENAAPALKNVSYSFKKGKKYAIVGASGSGKSTLTKLIMGYYDNYEGDVLINNHNVRDIDRKGLYSIIAALPQNVFLLDDTLRNNVTLYNNYSNEEYSAALKKASLLDVETALPKGSDTTLGEGGNTISGGERQRISIARAILKGSEVMVLDEATASLDNVTAADIEKSITEMEGLTCIFVTHRYTTEMLKKCDGILVMKSGELVEHGTFDELHEAKGHFYSLLNINA